MLKQDCGGVNVVAKGPMTESVQVKLSVVSVFAIVGWLGRVGGQRGETGNEGRRVLTALAPRIAFSDCLVFRMGSVLAYSHKFCMNRVQDAKGQ